MKKNVIPALVVLCMAWQVQAAPVSGSVFSATDEAKVQTLTPQDQERVRKSLAEAQGSGIGIQSLTLIQQPAFAGTRIDHCLKNDPGTCGDQNATVVCKISGFRRSIPGGFAVDGISTTFYLATDNKCSGSCGAFTYVICENP